MQHTTHRPATTNGMQPEWVNVIAGTIAKAVIEHVRHQIGPLRPQAAPNSSSPFMSVTEAAAYLRCKPQRVYDLLSAQTLGRYKDGARVLIRRAELEMYVTAMEQTRMGAQRANGRL